MRHGTNHDIFLKESEALLKDTNIDTDAKTRHQANEISKLIPAKLSKPQLTKTQTMVATTKVN